MLVVVHHRDVESFLKSFLDVEAFRSLDILQIDATEGRCNAFNGLAELFRIFLVDLNVEDVDATIDLEEQSLTLHDGFAAHGTNVAQAQHGSTIADDSYQIALGGIFIRIVWVLLDFQTGVGDTWRIGQREVCLRTIGLGGLYFNFARTTSFVIGQSCFFRDLYHLCCVYY